MLNIVALIKECSNHLILQANRQERFKDISLPTVQSIVVYEKAVYKVLAQYVAAFK